MDLEEGPLPPYPDDLVLDMMACQELMTVVEDDEFAKRLNASLCNRMWFKIMPDQQGVFDRLKMHVDRDKMKYNEYWSASWRAVGGIIADLRRPYLRRLGKQLEDYMCWYCSGSEGCLFDDVKEILNKINWYSFEENDSSVI